MHILWSYSCKIIFSGITSANRNRGRCIGSRGTLPCKISAPSAKRAQIGAENPHFSNFFVSKTTPRFTPFSADDIHKIWTQNVNRCGHEFFRSRNANFFDNGSFTQKRIFGFWGSTVRAPTFAFMPTANLNIAPYSRRALRMFALRVTPRKFAIFRLPLQRRLVRYSLHIWQFGRPMEALRQNDFARHWPTFVTMTHI